MNIDDTQPMPEGWVSHPNSKEKFSRVVTVAHVPPDKMSRVAVTISAKLRNDGAGWRWNIWFNQGPLNARQHIGTGWKIYRLEAAEEADAALTAAVTRYRLGVL